MMKRLRNRLRRVFRNQPAQHPARHQPPCPTSQREAATARFLTDNPPTVGEWKRPEVYECGDASAATAPSPGHYASHLKRNEPACGKSRTEMSWWNAEKRGASI